MTVFVSSLWGKYRWGLISLGHHHKNHRKKQKDAPEIELGG